MELIRVSSNTSLIEPTDFYRTFFYGEKDLNGFINKCVSLIRKTPEYKEWVKFVHDILGVQRCALSLESDREVTIEIHHHPLTLFDITEIVLNTIMERDKKVCSMDVMKEVIRLHFENKVGYIPLLKSLHEKYHNGFLIIPPKYVRGDWSFLISSSEYICSDEKRVKALEYMKDEYNVYDGMCFAYLKERLESENVAGQIQICHTGADK